MFIFNIKKKYFTKNKSKYAYFIFRSGDLQIYVFKWIDVLVVS